MIISLELQSPERVQIHTGSLTCRYHALFISSLVYFYVNGVSTNNGNTLSTYRELAACTFLTQTAVRSCGFLFNGCRVFIYYFITLFYLC